MYKSIKQANKRSNDWCPWPRSVLKFKLFFFGRKKHLHHCYYLYQLSTYTVQASASCFTSCFQFPTIILFLDYADAPCSLLQGNRFCYSGNIVLLLGMQTIIIFVSLSWKQTETVGTVFRTHRLVRCQSWRQCLT